ncbi:MAG: phage holin family protein [Deltaproteobacteria bacterium]|nr:phage holin family protein [Deltaproteobacteria bacterium]
MSFVILRWLILSAAIIIASYLLDGIHVRDFFSAVVAAAMLGFFNMFFRPILILLTLPINILSLGLFTFLINAFLLKLVAGVVSGFDVVGFWTAVFGALIISLVNWILGSYLQKDRMFRMEVHRHDHGGYIDLEKENDDRWK